MEGGLFYTLVKCSIKCLKCDNFMPLNGPLLLVHCDFCQSDSKIPEKFWKDIFGEFYEKLKGESEGKGESLDITGSEWFSETTVSFHRVSPFCPACSAPFDVNEGLTVTYKHICSECGNEIVVVPVPQWLSKVFPKAKILVNADLQGEKKEEQVALLEPIVFTCPQCGGGLIVDGKERVLPCKFCGVSVYLPDDLWLRLHPARIKTRWFIGFEE